MSDDNFEPSVQSASGAARTPIQANNIKKGGHCMIKGFPCKVTEVSSSKTGKHGHAKVHVVGVDVFTGKKYEDVCPSTHKVEEPLILRRDYQLIGMEDGFVTLMDDGGNIKEDVKSPADPKLLEEIEAKLTTDEEFLASVISFEALEKIVALKPKPR